MSITTAKRSDGMLCNYLCLVNFIYNHYLTTWSKHLALTALKLILYRTLLDSHWRYKLQKINLNVYSKLIVCDLCLLVNYEHTQEPLIFIHEKLVFPVSQLPSRFIKVTRLELRQKNKLFAQTLNIWFFFC